VVFTLYWKETESEVIFVAFDSVVVQKCRRTSVRCNLVFNGHQATVVDNVILGQVFPSRCHSSSFPYVTLIIRGSLNRKTKGWGLKSDAFSECTEQAVIPIRLGIFKNIRLRKRESEICIKIHEIQLGTVFNYSHQNSVNRNNIRWTEWYLEILEIILCTWFTDHSVAAQVYIW
jgi:hypothetical protein